MKGFSAGGLQASAEVRRPTLTTDSPVLLHQTEPPGKTEEVLLGRNDPVQLMLLTLCPGARRLTFPAERLPQPWLWALPFCRRGQGRNCCLLFLRLPMTYKVSRCERTQPGFQRRALAYAASHCSRSVTRTLMALVHSVFLTISFEKHWSMAAWRASCPLPNPFCSVGGC